MAHTVQQSEVFATVQIEVACTSTHTSSHSSGSACDSQVTAVSRDPSTLSVPAEVSGAGASLVDVGRDGDQETSNTAAPAHIIHRPPPQIAAPTKEIPKFIELDPGLKFVPVSPTTMVSWRPPKADDLIIEPMRFGPSDHPLSGWTPCIHPEGQLYYRKECQIGLQIILVNRCAERLLLHLKRDIQVPPDFEVALYACQSTVEDTGDLETYVYYYLSTDRHRRPFWIQRVLAGLVTCNERQVHSEARLGHTGNSSQITGNSRVIGTSRVIQLLTLPKDRLTSETSTAPWDAQTLKGLIDIVRELDQCSMLILSAKNRFQHHCGEPWAQLNINESVKEDLSQKDLKRSLWFLCLQPLCFYLPDQYLGELDYILVDDMLHYTRWNHYINGLKRDWKNIMLPVTVLLTVDVGLLAIQSLDNGHAGRSIAQISSYCSAIMSIGAILMCIILSRHHRNDGQSSDMANVGPWLKNQVRTQSLGELFAITLSLPSVWFTWG
ncbi:hypothetical protein CERSUDRAFT_75126 [Gelatoporia subvermispora B]|uniref:WW domain-containing protein n=1 Tax=Ceriporiopsis subvermispora (strain B) TaxID=914234 RepID=M2PHL3_CERS8|nr:hypothetical protein CERSUDRAFT_75126 [Gelatoporia subvermispora B]